MRKLITLGSFSLALMLGACGGNSIPELETGLTAAEHGALIYTSSPKADPGTKADIKKADQTAYTLVKAAESTKSSGDVSAAEQALVKLSGLVPATTPATTTSK